MAEYLSQKELVKAIETNLDRLDLGALELSEIEGHIELVRELYERTVVLRYKAFEHHSSIEIAIPSVEEVVPVVEAQEIHQEEEVVEEDVIETNDIEEFEEKIEEEDHQEIEFDFFSSSDNTEEETIQETIFVEETTEFTAPNEPEDIVEIEEESEFEEQAKSIEIEPIAFVESPSATTGFSQKVFEVEREIRNQIGFNSLPTLVGSFGLNERLLYINELFDGSSESFSDTIKHLDNRSSLSEAATYIEDIATKFNWDIESETVEEFIQKLCRRYA